MSERSPIDRAFFRHSKDGEDGAPIFFPWGVAHRGYRLPDEAARKKASRAVSLLFYTPMGIGVWAAHVLQSVLESEASGLSEALRALGPPGAALLLVFAAYALWVSRFVERFPQSDLVVSREERMREAAEAVGPGKVALTGVATCAMSALLVWLEPRYAWLGLLGIALGVGVLVWGLVLKRAAADA